MKRLFGSTFAKNQYLLYFDSQSSNLLCMKDCIFCQVAAGEAPSWKVHENEHAYAFLNINPVSRYHTLVIPKGHYVNIFDASASAVQEVMAMVHYFC